MRTSKLTSLSDATNLVSDGMRLALGGFGIYQHPMAFVRELVRKQRRDLTIVGHVSGIEADMLIGAGAVKRLETSYIGHESYGLAKNTARLAESGRLEIVNYSEYTAFDRFRASQDNLPFWPCYYLAGNDILKRNPDIKQAVCPISGRNFYAIPAAQPDVVVIHTSVGDEYGNAIIPQDRQLIQSLDIIMSRSCSTLIVTVEKIISNAELRQRAGEVEIPAYRTTCIVEAPNGAHPTSMLGYYGSDKPHYGLYVEASATPEGFEQYLRKWIFGIKGEAEYQTLVATSGDKNEQQE
ncbi:MULTISPECIES: CoA-transferase [Sinorhizobium]|uniref:CoA transferase subunit A n=1 Tax=Sinorhizobium TaxID=28105 RepID=UPI000BE80E8F|nr:MULTISPECIES: CoA-transferase [Sinorhizobium]PDT50919.1 hypothetical protein CO664_24535 [Sinorhizobium sp. NG07B]POH25037.1 hypothetical protein ATY30_28775 [Sinorhizobium americanum]